MYEEWQAKQRSNVPWANNESSDNEFEKLK